MTSIRAALFDLDDTLYRERDFVDGGFRAVADFLAPELRRSATAIAAELCAIHDRDGRGRVFDRLLTSNGSGEDPDLVQACVLVYRAHRPHLVPLPDVLDTLHELRARGVRTGLVSDGDAGVQRRKLEALPEVRDLLDQIVLTDELGAAYRKPSPTPFRVACRLLGIPPSEAVYVANDPRKDFHGARVAGLATIRVGGMPDEGGDAPMTFDPAWDADRTTARFGDLLTLVET
jgi:putative hydrolase of the HAD superfamily